MIDYSRSSLEVNSRLVSAVWGEGVVGLVTQRCTVVLQLVKRLRDVDHRVLVQRDGVSVHCPVPAVHLNKHELPSKHLN